MRFKRGVYVRGACVELLFALQTMERLYRDAGHVLTVTSVADGAHSSRSLHYSGRAADLRIRDIPEPDVQRILALGRDELPQDFDLVLEPDHFHLEYDPRGRLQ